MAESKASSIFAWTFGAITCGTLTAYPISPAIAERAPLTPAWFRLSIRVRLRWSHCISPRWRPRRRGRRVAPALTAVPGSATTVCTPRVAAVDPHAPDSHVRSSPTCVASPFELRDARRHLHTATLTTNIVGLSPCTRQASRPTESARPPRRRARRRSRSPRRWVRRRFRRRARPASAHLAESGPVFTAPTPRIWTPWRWTSYTQVRASTTLSASPLEFSFGTTLRQREATSHTFSSLFIRTASTCA